LTAADRLANERRWKEAESLRQEMQRKFEDSMDNSIEVINEVHSANSRHEEHHEGKKTKQCFEIQDALGLPAVSETSTAHQLKDLMSAMKVDNERLQHEMNEYIHQRSGCTDGQMNQLHSRATELRKDFLKTITTERQTRPAITAGHRSAISKIVREWQNLEK